MPGDDNITEKDKSELESPAKIVKFEKKNEVDKDESSSDEEDPFEKE